MDGSVATAQKQPRTTTTEATVKTIRDCVSGRRVEARREEVEAVQPFAQRLMDDYGYPREQLQTHPQFSVRMRPSDEKRSYPVDIAVFSSADHLEEHLYLIVECKRPERADGIRQLELYLSLSPATLGVWYNGHEHAYIRKVHHTDGSITFEDLPDIPRNGQRIEDIGLFKRRDLKKPSNLKAVFSDIRNHLAGMAVGMTRDEALARELINVLFCKITDEQNTAPDDTVSFRAGLGESAENVQKRILALFETVKQAAYGDVFDEHDRLSLDAESLLYVVGALQNYSVMAADRDAVGDAFEVFIGPALRGGEGQFFTPRNVVKLVVEMLYPKPGERIIDPACGSGGFLITALEHVWGRLRDEAQRKAWSDRLLIRRQIEVATDCFRGIDKDAFLAKVCKAYMALVGDGRGGVFCANSLGLPAEWSPVMQSKVGVGTFDVVLTNPPFGAKIAVKGAKLLGQYDLGHKWSLSNGAWTKTATLPAQQSPQVLFLERCLQLLKPGGRLGIVLPESMVSNPSYAHVLQWLQTHARVNAVVALPEALFKTSGKGGTHTKVCVVLAEKLKPGSAVGNPTHEIFMADAKWCGHDSRGNPTVRKGVNGEEVVLDDIPLIAERFAVTLAAPARGTQDHLGFWLNTATLRQGVLVPKYYDPEIKAHLDTLSATHDLVSIGSLVEQDALQITTGVEVGKMAYGTGSIPFIRTSDISNWELKIDPKQGVSDEVYEKYKRRCGAQAGDILMVRDGTYLVGTSAILTESDTHILFQSHLYRIRVVKPDVIDPWLLFACLNAPIVKRQIRAKQFTQDIIDTLGNRILEVILPIPKDTQARANLSATTQEIVETRVALRNRARQVAIDVEGAEHVDEEEREFVETL